MKKIKKAISLALVCILCLSLCACAGKDSVTGTWTDNYIYEGNEFFVTLILDDDGHYAYFSYKNGDPSRAMEGKWELNGGEVCIYTETGSIEYEYKSGTLVNGSQTLTKD